MVKIQFVLITKTNFNQNLQPTKDSQKKSDSINYLYLDIHTVFIYIYLFYKETDE